MIDLNAIAPQAPDAELPAPDPIFTGERIQVAGGRGELLRGLLDAAGRAIKGKKATPEAPPAPPAPKPTKPAPKPKAAKAAKAKPARPAERAEPPTVPDDLPPKITPEEQAILDAAANPPPVEPARTALRNFSAEKLHTTDDIKALIDQRAAQYEGFMDARRGVVSVDQTMAESAAVDVSALIGGKPGKAFNAAQLAAGRDVLVSLSEQVSIRAKWLDANPAAATPQDLLEFRQMVAEMTAVQKWFQGAVSEAGRALQILGVNARGTRRFDMQQIDEALGATPASADTAAGLGGVAGGTRREMQQVADTLNDLGGSNTTLAIAKIIANAEGPAAVLKATRLTWQRRTLNSVLEYWINALLSNPATHAANITSNALFSTLSLAEHAMATGVGGVRRILGSSAERETLGEVLARAHGLMEGKVDGLRVFAKVAAGRADDLADKLELTQIPPSITASNFGVATESVMGRAINGVGAVVRVPGHLMWAEDAFFKTVAMRSSLRAQAYAEATREGLKGSAHSQRVAALVNDPPEGFIDAARAEADYLTFTQQLHSQEGALAQLGAKAQEFTATHPGAKFIIPFIRTPTNIALAVLERTPLAFASRRYRDAIKAGGREADLANSRWILGSAAGYGFYSAALEGRITGGGPSNPQLRQQWLAAGFRPYSVKVGDGPNAEWVSYSRLDPVGGLIGMAANAAETVQAATLAGEDVDMDAIAASLGLGFVETMTEKTYLTGVARLLDAVKAGEDNPAKMRNFLSQLGGSFVPAGVGAIEQMVNPTISDPKAGNLYDQTLNTIIGRIPGWSDEVQIKRDNFGAPITFIGHPLSPVKIAPDTKDLPENRIRRQLLGDGVALNVPTATLSVPRSDGTTVQVNLLAVDPTGRLLDSYRQSAGFAVRDRLLSQEADVMTRADLTERASAWETHINQSRGEARDLWVGQNAAELTPFADRIQPQTQQELTPP